MYGLECIRWLNSASSGLWTEGTGQEDPGRGPSFFICLHFLYGTSKHSKIENPCPRIFLWSPRMKRQLLTLWCKPPKMTDFPLSYLTRLQKNHAFWGGQARSLKQESEISSEQKNSKGAISWQWSSPWCKVTCPWKISRGDRPCLLWKNAGCVMATLQEVYVSLCF